MDCSDLRHRQGPTANAVQDKRSNTWDITQTTCCWCFRDLPSIHAFVTIEPIMFVGSCCYCYIINGVSPFLRSVTSMPVVHVPIIDIEVHHVHRLVSQLWQITCSLGQSTFTNTHIRKNEHCINLQRTSKVHLLQVTCNSGSSTSLQTWYIWTRPHYWRRSPSWRRTIGVLGLLSLFTFHLSAGSKATDPLPSGPSHHQAYSPESVAWDHHRPTFNALRKPSVVDIDMGID